MGDFVSVVRRSSHEGVMVRDAWYVTSDQRIDLRLLQISVSRLALQCG